MSMRIAYIAAGAAGMLCGTCIHDNTLAAAIQRQGQEIALIPTYTPIRTDEVDVSMERVFFGGLNVYLQQKSALFRHTPKAFDWLLDRPAILNGLSRFSGSTNAKDLGGLTVSMLRGEDGKQRKELAKLVAWLRDEYKPDIIQLTNSMFVGFAREMKREVGVPVLCAVQGEDIFLEDLIEPYKTDAQTLMRERAADLDGFVAASDYYAAYMADYLATPQERFHVIPYGLNLDGHGRATLYAPDEPFTVGYLARICPEKGQHLLVEAFVALAQEVGKENVRLRLAGYLGKRDEAYMAGLIERIAEAGLSDSFEHWGEVDRADKIRFFNSVHVVAAPTVYREPKGLFALEALANGVPVVLPSHGAFPELIEATNGGILVEPGSSDAVKDALIRLMHDAPLREALGRQGKEVVHATRTDTIMATQTIAVYEKYVA